MTVPLLCSRSSSKQNRWMPCGRRFASGRWSPALTWCILPLGEAGAVLPRGAWPRAPVCPVGLVAELRAGSQHGHAQQPGSCGRHLTAALGLGSAGLCSDRSAAQSQGHRALRCAKLTSAPRLKILERVTALTQIQRAPCLPLTEAGATEHGAGAAGIHVKIPGAASPRYRPAAALGALSLTCGAACWSPTSATPTARS